MIKNWPQIVFGCHVSVVTGSDFTVAAATARTKYRRDCQCNGSPQRSCIHCATSLYRSSYIVGFQLVLQRHYGQIIVMGDKPVRPPGVCYIHIRTGLGGHGRNQRGNWFARSLTAIVNTQSWLSPSLPRFAPPPVPSLFLLRFLINILQSFLTSWMWRAVASVFRQKLVFA